jgi:hypothetical protein
VQLHHRSTNGGDGKATIAIFSGTTGAPEEAQRIMGWSRVGRSYRPIQEISTNNQAGDPRDSSDHLRLGIIG